MLILCAVSLLWKSGSLEARDPKSEEFSKALNRKVSGLGALARSWKSGSGGQGPPKVKSLIRHSIGKCQFGEPWPEAGNLALEARGSKSEEFNTALNRKVSVWGALAKKVPSLPISFWHKNATTALGY